MDIKVRHMYAHSLMSIERFPRHRLQRKSLVRDPGMHRVNYLPPFLAHAYPAILRIWQDATVAW